MQPDPVVFIREVVGGEAVERGVLRQQGSSELPAGVATLGDLFESEGQLLVCHFAFEDLHLKGTKAVLIRNRSR